MPPSSHPPSAPGPDAGFPGRVPAWWPWGLGLLVGLVVVGPGLGSGPLLSLDLLVTPDIPVPPGVWGLGPALSQRVPLFAGLGLASAVVGGPLAAKAFLVGCTAAGFAGMVRLVRLMAPAGVLVAWPALVAAGLAWSAGPWALTRIGVGHLNLVWVVAVLPWALRPLCRPAEDLATLYLASLAMALGGPGGGTLGLTVAAVGILWTVPWRRMVRPAAVVLAPHVVWLAPTAVLLWAGAGVSGAGRFATSLDGVAGWLGMAAGGGFWRSDQQVGARGAVGALAGVAIVALVVVGGRRTYRHRPRRSWATTAGVVAVVGLGLSVASAVPGVRGLYEAASDLPVGAPLRESHRFAALWLVVAVPIAAVGTADVAIRFRSAVARLAPAAFLAVVLAVSVPGWWGIGGRLEPVRFPASWAAARRVIADAPATVVALPWSEYPQLSFADGRQAFNPMPDYFGGDVISSYDPRFEAGPSQEQVDARAVVVDEIVGRARSGRPVSAELADLGVRWVVLAHEPGWEALAALRNDPGLELVLDRPDLELFEVSAWTGPVQGGGRDEVLDRPLPPLIRTDLGPGAVVNVAGAPGWVQGWGDAAQVTDDGRLVTTGRGTLWFWPAIPLVAADVAVALGAIVAVRSRRRRYGRFLAVRARARLP